MKILAAICMSHIYKEHRKLRDNFTIKRVFKVVSIPRFIEFTFEVFVNVSGKRVNHSLSIATIFEVNWRRQSHKKCLLNNEQAFTFNINKDISVSNEVRNIVQGILQDKNYYKKILQDKKQSP